MATLNKKADISIPFILGIVLIIIILVVMVVYLKGGYSSSLSGLMDKLWGAL